MTLNLLDLLLVVAQGFLGSFGHCAGMCGPLTVSFSLSQQNNTSANWKTSLAFHFLLNFGRVGSYVLVGSALGGVGSVVMASGQLAGVGSALRQVMAIITGLMLIWFGLVQINPQFLPHLPLLHPIQGKLHRRLSSAMTALSLQTRWWTPAFLGAVWGLIPCGFLYAAQIKAAETSNLWWGGATMLAFGLGTMPMMLGVGVSASRLSASKRSQLFRLGGWVTLAIGILTLLRSDAMVDYTGHGAIFLLIAALLARPLKHIWGQLLIYRRALGVGSFVLALAHTAHMVHHSLNWTVQSVGFMLPQHQLGIATGTIALTLITPAALTSFDRCQQALGKYWRWIHLLSVPALVLAAIHTVAIGSHYLGELAYSWAHQIRSVGIVCLVVGVLLARSRRNPLRGLFSLFSLMKVFQS